MQHAGAAAAERRRTCRLDADQPYVGIVDEAGEHPDRVRAAADAGHDGLRQRSLRLEQLRARFADFFYYSVCTALISPPGDIFAASRGARSATMIEMLAAFALLTAYLSSFVDWQAREQPPAEK